MAWGLPDLPSLSGPTAQPQTPLGAVSPESLKARRELAAALQKQGMEATPIRHWTQGLGRVLQSTIGGYEQYREDQREREARKETADALAKVLSAGSGASPSDIANTATNPFLTAEGAALVQSSMKPLEVSDNLGTTYLDPRTKQVVKFVPKTATQTQKVGDISYEQPIQGTPEGGYRVLAPQGQPQPQAAPAASPAPPPQPIAPQRVSPGQIASRMPMGPDAPSLVGQRWPNDRLEKQTPTPDQVERVVSQAPQAPPQAPSFMSPRVKELVDFQQQQQRQKAVLGSDVEMLKATQERYGTMAALMPALDRAEQAVKAAPSGVSGVFAAQLANFLPVLGIQVPEGAQEAQVLQSLSTQIAPLFRQPGATSNAEMYLYMQAGPRLGDTREANLEKINLLRKIVRRAGDMYEIQRDYAGTPEMQNRLTKLANTPMFSREEREKLEKASIAMKDKKEGWTDIGNGVRIRRAD